MDLVCVLIEKAFYTDSYVNIVYILENIHFFYLTKLYNGTQRYSIKRESKDYI